MSRKVNKNKRKITTLIIIATSVIAILFYYNLAKKSNNQQSGGGFYGNMTLEVSALEIKKKRIEITKELPARVNAFEISEVRPEISGLIEKITFQEGSYVKAGKQLYQIDSSVQQADIEEAQANLNAAKSKAERFQKLLSVEGISRQEYDEVQSEFALARARLANAKQQLDRTKVLAPISGTVGKTNFTVGALATQNQQMPLTTITKLKPIYVDITQPTADAIKNRNNKNLKVSLIVNGEIYDGNGKLQFTQSFADESTDSVTLRAKFDNKDEKLIPGMFVTAKLHYNEFEAITIPQSAAMRNKEGNLDVYVINKDNIAELKSIIASQIHNNEWIVESGLNEGDIIIDKGLFKIRPGAKVKIQGTK